MCFIQNTPFFIPHTFGFFWQRTKHGSGKEKKPKSTAQKNPSFFKCFPLKMKFFLLWKKKPKNFVFYPCYKTWWEIPKVLTIVKPLILLDKFFTKPFLVLANLTRTLTILLTRVRILWILLKKRRLIMNSCCQKKGEKKRSNGVQDFF